MKLENKSTVIDFGKYRGHTIAEIVLRDIAYLQWCLWHYDELKESVRAQFEDAIKTATERRFTGYGNGAEVPVLFPNGQNKGMPVRWAAQHDPDYTRWFYRQIREFDSPLSRAIKSALEEVGVKV